MTKKTQGGPRTSLVKPRQWLSWGWGMEGKRLQQLPLPSFSHLGLPRKRAFRKSQRQSSSDYEKEEQHGHQPCTHSTRAFLTALCAVVLPPAPGEHPTALPSPSTPLQEPRDPALTFYVSVQRHHPGPLRAAEGRVVNVIRERGRDAGRGGSRGRHRVLGGVFFMTGSAVLKPNLKQKQQTLCQWRDNWFGAWSFTKTLWWVSLPSFLKKSNQI